MVSPKLNWENIKHLQEILFTLNLVVPVWSIEMPAVCWISRNAPPRALSDIQKTAARETKVLQVKFDFRLILI